MTINRARLTPCVQCGYTSSFIKLSAGSKPLNRSFFHASFVGLSHGLCSRCSIVFPLTIPRQRRSSRKIYISPAPSFVALSTENRSSGQIIPHCFPCSLKHLLVVRQSEVQTLRLIVQTEGQILSRVNVSFNNLPDYVAPKFPLSVIAFCTCFRINNLQYSVEKVQTKKYRSTLFYRATVRCQFTTVNLIQMSYQSNIVDDECASFNEARVESDTSPSISIMDAN